MSPAYLAAKAAECRRAEQSAEFARQLPLYQAEFAEPPQEYLDWLAERDGDERAFSCPPEADWSSRY